MEMTIKEAVERLDAIRSEMNARDRMAIDMVTDISLILKTAKIKLRERINELAAKSVEYDVPINMGSYPGLKEAESIIKERGKDGRRQSRWT